MSCFPLWLRNGSEKFLKCVWWGRRGVTLINSKLENAGETSQLQRENIAFGAPEIWSILPILGLFPEVQHSEEGRETGLGAHETAERLRRCRRC